MTGQELNQAYSLTPEQIDFYQKHRFIKLKQVLQPETLSHFEKEITREVEKRNTQSLPMDQRDTYAKAFVQIMNLWTDNSEIRSLIFSKRLAGIAAALMEVDGVRLYHDQALYKEAGGGFTPWHADQYYWPLTTDKTVTAWIPLQETPLEMGPLEFSAGSHQLTEGRDLAIGDESEAILNKKLRLNDFPQIVEPFEWGEISFHSGWVFHRAGSNQTDRVRKVMTIIYMDKNMRLKAPENANQQADWDTWCPGAKIGEIIDTPLNPVLI
jgi:ectoine hydroxylase-related dioxygenase (phytanoyl-CoA dioxygenase family)